MQFNKLRLSGFKSFVDPIELAIEPGLTGIVGPNGCGKSNLVEALKWVMGETSAKQMRGSEMEDVIFGGTGQRPARNIAEVMLKLDNKNRLAPPQFNDSDDLEVIRRIERGHGSLYKVNGKEIRARDVQTMFADAASGSRSTAMVSQGRIGALINAKPADRRMVIDEAAGITGLYARRHEAELRLKAAEANLLRVQDVLAALEEQHRQLKRQARQASRYRNLSDHIRRAEAVVLALRLAAADRELTDTATRLAEAEAAVVELTGQAAAAATAQIDAATGLPALRHEEAAAAAKLQRLRIAHENIAAEIARVEAARADGQARLGQIDADLARETERRGDAETALADLGVEDERLAAAQTGEDERHAAAVTARDAARAATAAAEIELDAVQRRIAADEAMAASVRREIAELNERLLRVRSRREQAENQRRDIATRLDALPPLASVEEIAATARLALDTARLETSTAIERARAAEREASDATRSVVTVAEGERIATEQAARAARETVERDHVAERQTVEQARAAERAASDQARIVERQAAEQSLAKAAEIAQRAAGRATRLKAEESGIAAALSSARDSLWPPMIDAIGVAAGFETALGAALGDELEASPDRGAPVYWQALADYADTPPLPEGVEPLAGHVTAPVELARRLAFIGIVADEAMGQRLQEGLRPGQQLVTRDGAVWRWDGFTGRAGAPSAAAARLAQRNRLAEVRADLAAASEEAVATEKAHFAARRALDAARQTEKFVGERARLVERQAIERAREAERIAVETARRDERTASETARNAERGAIQAARAADQAAQEVRRATERDGGRLVSEREAELTRARDTAARVAAETGRHAAQIASLDETLAQVAVEQADLEIRRGFREARRSWIPDSASDHTEATAMRAQLAEARAALVESQALCDSLGRDADARWDRRRQIATDRQGWDGRLAGAVIQIAALDERGASVRAQLAEIEALPERLAGQHDSLADDIATAETERQGAADRLAVGESRLATADKTLRQVEADLAAARESRVRREGQAEQAERDRQGIVERIEERLKLTPEAVLEATEAASLEELPDVESAERRLEKLVHERETMGAVNLRAEEEAAEIDRQIVAMAGERDDLTAAIGRLRQGIGSLNREGRERFMAAFVEVNRHFQELFTKLFGGGKAELRLTESEDPLEAGLEIVASPPGKKFQVMSLLSGGEQALTALALLFAVFMTNPAPICVLDEVDAPLDDANVERFCDLVKEIAGRADTRFLIITHHRVTMAKMHRLYGVTMAERGVSTLVSVDLEQAERVVNEAVAA